MDPLFKGMWIYGSLIEGMGGYGSLVWGDGIYGSLIPGGWGAGAAKVMAGSGGATGHLGGGLRGGGAPG